MSDLFPDFTRLIVKARAEKISEADIVRTAGLHPRYLARLQSGELTVSQALLRRLHLTIDRIRKRDMDPHGHQTAAVYRIVVAWVADKMGVEPKFILSADPGRRATADPDWLRASKYRHAALYIMNVYLGKTQADLARAAGMSRAAVCKAVQDVEEGVDDPKIAELLRLAEGAFL